MKMTMKNIHVLSTNKETRLFTSNSELTLAGYPVTTFKTGKHIYITNSEQIKEGQNYIGDGFSGKNKFKWHKSQVELYPNIKKDIIILTTDIDLIKDGVQAIDDEFLEWFVKNPSCEKVELIPYLKDIINPLTNEKYPAVQHRHFDETKMIFTYHYQIIIPKEEPKQSTKDRIMSETSEETKQKARDYGNSLIKQDRTCTHNCSAVCVECQILEPKPLLSVEWLLRYIEDLNNKGYTFIPSSNKEVVEHIKQMQKDNMIAFLKFVFQQDGFDYEQAYNNFLKQQIL